MTADTQARRQVVYWRLLAAAFGQTEHAPNVEGMAGELADELGLPRVVLDPAPSVDTVQRRYPELKADFDALRQTLADAPDDAPDPDGGPSLRRGLVYSKLLLNVFGPNAQKPKMSAADYRQWCEDVARMEQCFGCGPGDLRGQPGSGRSGSGTGGGLGVSEEQLEAGLKAMEADIIHRMALREVLADDTMAAQLSPSMDLTEQLLLDKGGLSGNALKNAKLLVQQYVDQLAEVIKKQVANAVRGKIDRSVPPKRVFRNLDLKRTVWKNLTNYSPAEGRLYVDRLFYTQTATKILPKTLTVVVDQSGSMVDAMVQSAILASIFASLPKVQVHLIAYDTSPLDLTPWVHEPFETLMRTNLGGGTNGVVAMPLVQETIREPRNTTLVWISDYHDNQALMPMFKAIKESGVRFIPVGSLKGSGHFDVNSWFRDQLKQLGTPVLNGKITKLIHELRDLL